MLLLNFNFFALKIKAKQTHVKVATWCKIFFLRNIREAFLKFRPCVHCTCHRKSMTMMKKKKTYLTAYDIAVSSLALRFVIPCAGIIHGILKMISRRRMIWIYFDIFSKFISSGNNGSALYSNNACEKKNAENLRNKKI